MSFEVYRVSKFSLTIMIINIYYIIIIQLKINTHLPSIVFVIFAGKLTLKTAVVFKFKMPMQLLFHPGVMQNLFSIITAIFFLVSLPLVLSVIFATKKMSALNLLLPLLSSDDEVSKSFDSVCLKVYISKLLFFNIYSSICGLLSQFLAGRCKAAAVDRLLTFILKNY